MQGVVFSGDAKKRMVGMRGTQNYILSDDGGATNRWTRVFLWDEAEQKDGSNDAQMAMSETGQ